MMKSKPTMYETACSLAIALQQANMEHGGTAKGLELTLEKPAFRELLRTAPSFLAHAARDVLPAGDSNHVEICGVKIREIYPDEVGA